MDKLTEIKEKLGSIFRNPKNIDCFAELILPYKDWQTTLYDVVFKIITGENGRAIKDAYDVLQKGQLGFDDAIYAEENETRNAHDHFAQNPPEVEEGVLECPKCCSMRVFSFPLQTRSGDESTTVFAKCAECKHDWQANNN